MPMMTTTLATGEISKEVLFENHHKASQLR